MGKNEIYHRDQSFLSTQQSRELQRAARTLPDIFEHDDPSEAEYLLNVEQFEKIKKKKIHPRKRS